MAKQKTIKKDVAVKRVGANRQKVMDEQRALRSRMIMSSFKRILKAVAVCTFAVAAGYAVFVYSPAISERVSERVKNNQKLYTDIRITNCSKHTEELLKSALDSLVMADSQAFSRAAVLRAAITIPEIEKVSIKKIKNRMPGKKMTSIKVAERKPVALVHGGGIFLVDEKGIRFTARPGQYYDLPLLIVDDKNKSDTVDLKVFNMIRKTSRNLGDNFFQQISQIDLSDSCAVNIFFKSGEAKYKVANEDIEKRLIHVKKLRERLMEVHGHGEPAQIDLRYRNLAFAGR